MFARTLRERHPTLKITAWDRLLDAPDDTMRDAMVSAKVDAIRPEMFGHADWIISAVTADQSLLAAESIAKHISQGQVYIDINSVSPSRKQATAALVAAKGAHYIDMAVMAPVIPKGHATPTLIAGERAEDIAETLTALGFDFRNVGVEPGQATAIKMVRSLFVKGLEAITVETLLAAEASGCYDDILSSLRGSFPGLDWDTLPGYQFERSIRHGKRRAAEMRESAATISELGLTGSLAAAVAEVQDAMAETQAGDPDNIREVLARRLQDGKTG